MTHSIVDCTLEEHGAPILAILNEAIENSTAVWDLDPRSADSMVGWFSSKVAGNFPVVGIIENDELVAFGTYGTFRAWPGYRLTVEHSVYARADQRGKGYGKIIMNELIARAKQQGMHAIIGGIEATNTGSIVLHEKLGFTHVGTLPQVGRKFDRWLDLAFYELILD